MAFSVLQVDSKQVKRGSAGNPSKYEQKSIKIPTEYEQNIPKPSINGGGGPGLKGSDPPHNYAPPR